MKTTTDFQLVATDKLIPYVNNARTHSPEQIKKLRSSLREFGFVNPVIIDREYNATGYLVKAAMLEPSGKKSELKYEYDDEGNLRRRTLTNVAEQVKSVNEYTYNDDGEIKTQSQKVFDKTNECILSINMKNEYTDHDDEGNWTRNELKLMYWEKGRQARNMNVVQTRTISYWEEE